MIYNIRWKVFIDHYFELFMKKIILHFTIRTVYCSINVVTHTLMKQCELLSYIICFLLCSSASIFPGSLGICPMSKYSFFIFLATLNLKIFKQIPHKYPLMWWLIACLLYPFMPEHLQLASHIQLHVCDLLIHGICGQFY